MGAYRNFSERLGGLILEGDLYTWGLMGLYSGPFHFSERLGGLILEGVIHEGAYIRNFTVFEKRTVKFRV